MTIRPSTELLLLLKYNFLEVKVYSVCVVRSRINCYTTLPTYEHRIPLTLVLLLKWVSKNLNVLLCLHHIYYCYKNYIIIITTATTTTKQNFLPLRWISYIAHGFICPVSNCKMNITVEKKPHTHTQIEVHNKRSLVESTFTDVTFFYSLLHDTTTTTAKTTKCYSTAHNKLLSIFEKHNLAFPFPFLSPASPNSSNLSLKHVTMVNIHTKKEMSVQKESNQKMKKK